MANVWKCNSKRRDCPEKEKCLKRKHGSEARGISSQQGLDDTNEDGLIRPRRSVSILAFSRIGQGSRKRAAQRGPPISSTRSRTWGWSVVRVKERIPYALTTELANRRASSCKLQVAGTLQAGILL